MVACALGALTTAEPSCENVTDFGYCEGNVESFCPENIACSCKEKKPFCSCPYYKGPNSDFWYMGAKCDQLWSTQDLILVIICPAVALAFVVAVTAQLIHFCKSKPKKKKGIDHNQKTRQTTQSHQNQAYVPEMNINPIYMQQPLVTRQVSNMPAAAPHMAQVGYDRPQASNYPSQLDRPSFPGPSIPGPANSPYYSEARPQVSNMPPAAPQFAQVGYEHSQAQGSNYPSQMNRPPVPEPTSPRRNSSRLPYYQSHQSGDESSESEEDYHIRRPEYRESHHFKPRTNMPEIPQPDYRSNVAGPSSNAQLTERPFTFARPQIRNSYDYQ
ncbi:uncharacterized protein O3C94_012807 [Discoglossus pictus]